MFKPTLLSRRMFVAAGAAFGLLAPAAANALSPSRAEKHVSSALGEINRLIASGKGEAALLRDFRSVFRRYGDVRGIALTTLGPARREASPKQLENYIKAFETYFSNKYGRRFREYAGGEIKIESTRPAKGYVEVRSKAYLKGQQPFAVFWRVSDQSGSPRIQNMIVGGVNVLTHERLSIRRMLNREKGDIDKLIARLRANS